ncbi:hypothetical protein JCM8115_003429 [Rhodotorula mucilaginosa]
MLSAAFTNRLSPASSTADHASVIVLSDSQFEPSLVVLRQFVHAALRDASSSARVSDQSTTPKNRNDQARYGRQRQRQRRPKDRDEEQNVVLISLEHAPERILPTTTCPATRERERVRIIDATLSGPYCCTSATTASSTTRHVDLSGDSAGHDPTTLLLNAIRDSIAEMDRSARRPGGGGGSSLPPQTQQEAEEAAEEGKHSKRPVLVVIDSVNALADEFSCSTTTGGGGCAAAARCIKRIWETLRGRRGSRLLLVHHDDFPSFPAGPSASTAATDLHLLPYLLSPSLSPSTLHLLLRPSAHLELLSREYGLPTDPDEIASDPRTRGFLESLGKRRVGEAWKRPERVEEEDERIQGGRLLVAGVGVVGGGGGGGGHRDGSFTDVGRKEEEEAVEEERQGGGGGGCIVEWSSRGLLEEDPSSSSSSSFGRSTRTSTRGTGTPFGTSSNDAAGAGAGEVKRVVRMGYTAVQVVRGSGGTALEVREVAVGQVLDPKRMGVRAAGSGGGGRGADEAFPSTAKSNALQSPGPASSSVDRSNPNSSATSPAASTAAPTALPFSLDLTEQQRLARSRVLNPYAGIDKPIYGEEGYQVPVVPGLGVAGGTGTGSGSGGGGGVEYVADRGDDLDEEDPDEDLEL